MTSFLFHKICKSLGVNDLAVRQDHLLILQHILKSAPGNFPAAARLTHSDPELDFFNNVAHLQLHRRSRAWDRLLKVLQESNGELNVRGVSRVVLPLMLQAIFEGNASEDRPHKMTQVVMMMMMRLIN